MSSNPQFSVVLPVRNGGEHLKLCVASVLAQTLPDCFELLVLDNASTDGTSAWLANLRDPRVRVLPSDRPLTIEENWARIKDLHKREYVTTIGHDDLLDPNFLEIITRLIHQHPDAGLYLTHFRLIDEQGQFLRHCLPMPTRETAAEFLAARLCDLRESFGTGHVLRSSAYDALGGIPPFPKLLYADDALFLQAIGSTYRATAPDEVFSYRWHAASASTGCAMRDLFSGLEQYTCLLERQCAENVAMREVLRRYFLITAVSISQLWRDEELLAAYKARRKLAPAVDQRITALMSRFGDSSPAPPSLRGAGSRLLEAATRSFSGRLMYGVWRWQQWSRQTASRWLAHSRRASMSARS